MAGSGQRANGQVSGGMSIDDHAFFGGAESKETILPMGVKFKNESSAEGASSIKNYEDTSEAIKAAQVEGVRQIKKHPMKPHYRG